MKALESLAKQNPLLLAAGAVLVIATLYYFTRKAVTDVAAGVTAVGGAAVDTVTGIATGVNPITQATPYEGTGIFGTYGAAVNRLLGGVPQSIGEGIGDAFYNLLHGDEQP